MPATPKTNTIMLVPPLPEAEARMVRLEKTANITSIPDLGRLQDSISVPVMLKVGDNISTDDIMPAGARVMPLWTNIPKMSEYTFEPIDETYPQRARQGGAERRGHAIVGGANYGQGSSRENAALAPRFLGLEVVLAKTYARIHWQNLVNFGVLPLTFADPASFDELAVGDMIEITGIRAALEAGSTVTASIARGRRTIDLKHDLSARQIDVLLRGGVINWLRDRRDKEGAAGASSSEVSTRRA